MTYLPGGLGGQTCDGHAVQGPARARSHPRLVLEALTDAGATTRELDDKALTHELGSI